MSLYEKIHPNITKDDGFFGTYKAFSYSSLDVSALYKDDFDAQDYVKTFLGSGTSDAHSNDEEFSSDSSRRNESISSHLRVSLSRLSLCITEVDQRIHELVSQHGTEFLLSIKHVSSLYGTMKTIQHNLSMLDDRAQWYVLLRTTHTQCPQSDSWTARHHSVGASASEAVGSHPRAFGAF